MHSVLAIAKRALTICSVAALLLLESAEVQPSRGTQNNTAETIVLKVVEARCSRNALIPGVLQTQET